LTKQEEMKQVILIRTDIKMGKGKMVAQGSHASVASTLLAIKNKVSWYEKWNRTGGKKVVCKVQSEKDLVKYFNDGLDLGLPSSIINDAGHTQLAPGTTTAVAIGPAPARIIDQITSELKLL